MCESLYQEQEWEKMAEMRFRPFSEENLWSVDMTLNNSQHLYSTFPQKFHPIHVWEQTVGTSITGTPCISVDSHFTTICMRHLYQSWFQFITDCSETCGPDPSLWATITVNACTIYFPVPYQSIHERVACIPHDSLQFDAVWYHKYNKYQHTDVSTETN